MVFGVQRNSPSPIGQMVYSRTWRPPGRRWGHLGECSLAEPEMLAVPVDPADA